MKSDVITCSRRGMENPGYSRYCRGCGYELPKVAVENTVAPTPVKSPKKVSLGLTIGLVIGGLLIGIIIGIIIGSAATYVYTDFSQSKLTIPDKTLMETASNANRNLPMMIDSETRLDNMAATDNKTFRYTYTLVNMEAGKVDTTAMKSKMEPYIINNVKTSPEMESQRQREITFVFYYKDKNGNYLFSIAITPDKYK